MNRGNSFSFLYENLFIVFNLDLIRKHCSDCSFFLFEVLKIIKKDFQRINSFFIRSSSLAYLVFNLIITTHTKKISNVVFKTFD